MKILYKLALLFIFLVSASNIFAQQTELQRGVELYRQGKNDEAITVLEKLGKVKNTADEPTVLNYLGMAYLVKNDLKKALKSLEKAVELNPQNAAFRANLAYAYLRSNKLNNAQNEANKAIEIEPKLNAAYYIRGTAYLWEGKFDEALADADRAIALNTDFSSAYTLKSETLVAQFGKRIASGSNAKKEIEFLSKAVETLETCVKNCQKNPDLQSQSEKLESLKVFYEYFNREKTGATSQTLSPDDTTTPLKITYKAHVNYTDQARSAFVSGKIVVAVLFAANGKVTQTIVIKPLGYGLDQEAMKAAKNIRFEPALKNGIPISVVKVVEYIFSIR
jgi:TonB family protein